MGASKKGKGKKVGGFGWMAKHDPERLRKISRAAAATPSNIETRHKWTSEEASAAARKGALKRWKKEKK